MYNNIKCTIISAVETARALHRRILVNKYVGTKSENYNIFFLLNISINWESK